MIISASRRTDIPAFYTPWLLGRIKAGFVRIANPYFPEQIREVSLRPQDVDLFVFWSKNPAPLLPHLSSLTQQGYPYYVHYTLTGYPPPWETATPPLTRGLETFRRLSRLCGPDRVIWRYDPIILTSRFTVDYHVTRFTQIAAALKGCTLRVHISFFDYYKTAVKRIETLPETGLRDIRQQPAELAALLQQISASAAASDLQLYSCAETLDLSAYHIQQGKCIDDLLIEQQFGLSFPPRKDPGQRKSCACIKSCDIGSYNTCTHDCLYCYATRNPQQAEKNYAEHDPAAPCLKA